jgi:UDP-N-acetyl-D-glucosamine/UDP-N-acetyl-D-galactosamine dehydrogenase
MNERIAIVGLGYVGLPVAVSMAKKFEGTVGFDVSERRVAELQQHNDPNGEISTDELMNSGLIVSNDPAMMKGATFFIITVPTPIDDQNRPNLTPLRRACEFIGSVLSPGAVVVLESTVYPGVTEDFCGPLLELHSGLKRGSGFKLAYSPERINPGDRGHRFEQIIKVISAEDPESFARVRHVYGSVVQAGIFEASSIKVAEAAKVLENTQRDLNIALMNELSKILDVMSIPTADVLAAAGTKWNFLKFTPGLVGGHCIGVDPYYLTALAEKIGYRPEVILAGRRINDGMATYVAQRIVKLLMQNGFSAKSVRAGVMGVTFKENVPDIRNSKVFEMVRELRSYGLNVELSDPIANTAEVQHQYGCTLQPDQALNNLDILILAVPHSIYLNDLAHLQSKLRHGGILIDPKSAIPNNVRRADVTYWSL